MNNLILTGYRGTGKSVLGMQLHEVLGLPLLDTDEWIIGETGKRIPEIFSEYGEEYFRDQESRAVAHVSSLRNHVIATGGGIIEREQNRQILRECGFTVWLTASVDTIFERIYNDSNRPSLTGLSPREEIASVLTRRNPLYRECAMFEHDTGKHDVQESIEQIRTAYSAFIANSE